METPKLTKHARERCAQMGISTERAKRCVQKRTTTYPSPFGHSNNGLIVQSASEPDISVVWDPNTDTIITVVPRVKERYVRPEKLVVDSNTDATTKETP